MASTMLVVALVSLIASSCGELPLLARGGDRPTPSESITDELEASAFPVGVGHRSVLVDDFSARAWTTNRAPNGITPAMTYSPERSTEGRAAIHLRTDFEPDPVGLDFNLAEVEVTLPTPEDWSAHDFVTVDIYMAEQPTGLAEARLTLTDSRGESASVPLILGWQLFQFENYQMTFSLTGNAYIVAPIPPEVLADVAKVAIGITRYSDTDYGTPYRELNFAIDNLRLSGSQLWESFDGPRWTWSGEGSGITNAVEIGSGGNTLRIDGSATGTPIGDDADVIEVGALTARVLPRDEAIPRVTVVTERDGVTLDPQLVRHTVGHDTIAWILPEPVVSSDIRGLRVEVPDGTVAHIDDLTLVTDAELPRDIEVTTRHDRAEIAWNNPLVGEPQVVRVWARDEAGEITMVCEASGVRERASCAHHHGADDAGTSVYAVEPVDIERAALASAPSGTIRWQPDGTTYAIGVSEVDGDIVYIEDVETGALLSSGNADSNLWSMALMDETTFPSLQSGDFSADDEARRFAVTDDGHLSYRYDVDGRRIDVDIEFAPVDRTRFDLRATVTNHSGVAIRSVTLPERLSFPLDGLRQALFPIQEGLVLLPAFFEAQRSSKLARPPMFADVLAYEATDRDFAIHIVQDSRYQAELIPHHPVDQPVFQPSNLGVGTIDGAGYFEIDMITYIPDGATWTSPTVRVSGGRDFRQIAADYRVDNGIDEYPDLAEKLGGEAALTRLAQSPVLAVELYKSVEWLKADEGEVWSDIRDEWLDALPSPAVLHLTHWQKGRDWYDDPAQNHKVEDDHPEALPIWWERYGPENEFLSLLEEAERRDLLTMPFTNWSVWNTYDPTTLEIPSLEQTPAAATTLRGAEYPHLEYKGYMVEPWHDDVRDRNDQMFATYTDVYPQDLMFVDMTAERSWRYVSLDDGATASAAVYTQSVANENDRLAQMKPLFTEGVFDRLGSSLTGYAQTLRQKFWNQILVHLGSEYEDWTTYPFAADVLHDKVAFYQHDLNFEVWPGEERALATYYSLYGYNYMIDITKHLREDDEMVWALDMMQKAVNARTFGERLLDIECLGNGQGVHRTTWGPENNPLSIVSNFDTTGAERTLRVGGHELASDGFLATSRNGDIVAGIFEGTFANEPLTDGAHWIVVSRSEGTTEIEHALGHGTFIRIDRPNSPEGDVISIRYVLADGTEVPAHVDMVVFDGDAIDVLYPRTVDRQPVRSVIVEASAGPAEWSRLPLMVDAPPSG